MNRIRRRHLLLIGAGLIVAQWSALAADPNLARNLSATCANCHGTDGRTVGSTMVSLAGQTAPDIITKLSEFKDGKRPATIMHQIAKGLSDEQVKLVAEFFAQQK